MKLNIKKQLPATAGLLIGGVASGYIGKLLPIANPKIKAGATILAGMLLASQKGMVSNIGSGVIAGAGRDLATSFGIAGPFITGVEDVPVFVTGSDDIISNDSLNGFDNGNDFEGRN